MEERILELVNLRIEQSLEMIRILKDEGDLQYFPVIKTHEKTIDYCHMVKENLKDFSEDEKQKFLKLLLSVQPFPGSN